MDSLMKWFTNEESGQGMVEYGLILALIACVVVFAVSGLGKQVAQKFTDVTSQLTPPAAH